MLRVNYTGAGARVLAYKCWGGRVENAACRGVSFGGQADQLVVQQVLEAVSGNAIEAALQAAAQERTRQGEHRRSLEIGVEQARYQARLAERRYEAVDPEQRWVAGELEARWNQALERVREAEAKCVEFDQRLAATAVPSQELLVTLAEDLQTVWNTAADMRLKQRIVHLVLREIVADYDPESREVTLVLHWAGGRHILPGRFLPPRIMHSIGCLIVIRGVRPFDNQIFVLQAFDELPRCFAVPVHCGIDVVDRPSPEIRRARSLHENVYYPALRSGHGYASNLPNFRGDYITAVQRPYPCFRPGLSPGCLLRQTASCPSQITESPDTRLNSLRISRGIVLCPLASEGANSSPNSLAMSDAMSCW
jgi:hypothetical protein